MSVVLVKFCFDVNGHREARALFVGGDVRVLVEHSISFVHGTGGTHRVQQNC